MKTRYNVGDIIHVMDEGRVVLTGRIESDSYGERWDAELERNRDIKISVFVPFKSPSDN